MRVKCEAEWNSIIIVLSLLSLSQRDLETNKTTLNMEVCPESLGAMSEY